MQIYAIGGGKADHPRMLEHYARIVELARIAAQGSAPRMALLPTAHRNGLHSALSFRPFLRDHFTKIGCEVAEILIGDVAPHEREHSNAEIRETLERAHALYVLGGDTRYLLNAVRARNLETMIEERARSGLVLTGSSAGAIWLSSRCISDSEAYQNPLQWSYITLEGLGLLPFFVNVHDNQGVREGLAQPVDRSKHFEACLVRSEATVGLAIDNFVALHIVDGRCRVAGARSDDGAYILRTEAGQVARTKIEGELDLQSLSSA
jgi:peptidase E